MKTFKVTSSYFLMNYSLNFIHLPLFVYLIQRYMFFGNKIRDLRENKGLVLRQVAAAIEVDTATISKIERGDRQAKEEQLELFAEILNADIEELKTLWLAEKVYQAVKGKVEAKEALNKVIEIIEKATA